MRCVSKGKTESEHFLPTVIFDGVAKAQPQHLPGQPLCRFSVLHNLKSDGGQCNPPNRTWDENTQEKCIRCTKAGDECGPNLTQFESDTTSRGKKRKARLSLDHGSTQSNWRARSDFGNPRPQSSSHDGPDTTEASSGKEPSFAAGDDNTKPESTPRVERYGSPVDANSM